MVEGSSDEKVVQEINRKLAIKAEIRLMRGYNLSKAKRYARLLLSQGCKKIIILKDSHSSDPSEVRKEVEDERGLDKFDKDVKVCIVVHAIESWLLADEAAIGDYLGIEVGKVHAPEDICDPAKSLEDIFKKAGSEYYKNGKDPAEVAKRLSLKKVQDKCLSFNEFRKLLVEDWD